ncbi:MAG TPA: hypothetical protein VF902_07295 [Coriobacteriia bacterium]
MSVGAIVGGLVRGVALGLSFNPVTALVGAVAAAALAGYPGAPDSRRPLALGVLGLAWLAGDGARVGVVVTSARMSGDAAVWAAVVAWVAVGATVGYLAPMLAGITVGRRVLRGTGWLSAGAVALTVAGALALVAPALAESVSRIM